MNKKIGIYSSVINIFAVISFAIFMLFDINYGSYLVSIFIALSFVSMVSTFSFYSNEETKAFGFTAIAFASIYSVLVLIVYYTQITSVAFGNLNSMAINILDYSKFGLFFNLDLLGYGIMALSTFFISFTIQSDRILKLLLRIHGIFFISGFLMPLFNLFNPDMADGDKIGVIVLEIWCLYFLFVGFFSFKYFNNK